MIRHLGTFASLLAALDAIGKARHATDALIQRLCASFAAMVAECTGQRVVVAIGETVIARGSK